MNNTNVTENQSPPATSVPASGSEAKPTNIAEWFRYLTETGNFNAYWCDGSANCKRIEAGFAAWKAAQGQKAKPLNSVLSDPCKESETINPNKK